MTSEELKPVLEKHRAWVLGEENGQRADLRRADLQGADLRRAYLQGADLRRAYLQGADLDPIMADYFSVLAVAKSEVTGLYKAILEGRIDGSSYQGDCACLVGTVANLRHEGYRELKIDLKPDANRLSEKWFLGIAIGDTPKSNPISEITAEWTREFMKENGIAIPEMRTIWSDQ